MTVVRTLSVRDFSDDPAAAVYGDGLEHMQEHLRVIVLIHGFANTQAQAQRKFETFIENVVAAHGEGAFHASAFGFHWPGDHPLGTPLSQVTYRKRITPARESGERLATALREHLDPRQQVIMVAHSLGCRVLLSALKELDERPGPQIKAVYLMAAAVPIYECEGTGTYAKREWRPVQIVLHSLMDTVLGRWFRGGEAWEAGTRLRGRKAVGHTGLPGGSRWNLRLETRYDHGFYWCSNKVAGEVATAVKAYSNTAIAAARRSERPSHKLPAWIWLDRKLPSREPGGACD
jgi:pimeloyl-ACP methyl ester carboxylesterase